MSLVGHRRSRWTLVGLGCWFYGRKEELGRRQGLTMRVRRLLVFSLLALVAFVPPAAEGQEGFDGPELPSGTVTVAGEFTSGKFLDPGVMATSPERYDNPPTDSISFFIFR